MALIEQYPYIDMDGNTHNDLIYHYSDNNKQIRQIETNILYIDAIDKYPCEYTYEETDIDIPNDDENEIIEGDIE